MLLAICLVLPPKTVFLFQITGWKDQASTSLQEYYRFIILIFFNLLKTDRFTVNVVLILYKIKIFNDKSKQIPIFAQGHVSQNERDHSVQRIIIKAHFKSWNYLKRYRQPC